MLGDLSRLLNLENQTIAQTRVRPGHLVALINLIEGGSLSGTLAKAVLEEAFASGEEPDKIVADRGYAQINDASVVSSAVAQAIAQNPKAVADYVNGKDTAARFLVGQVMKITRGQAKPELALQLVQQGLEAAKNAWTTHRLR
jgi:aspartyl-tRNA(Asn)/glutamyl-tRNA(Gln) amidotransferase subunit B